MHLLHLFDARAHPSFFTIESELRGNQRIDVPKSAIDENPTSDAAPTYPPIAFDVEITILQLPSIIYGGGMTNLANVCDNYALSSALESEEKVYSLCSIIGFRK